MDNLDIRDMKVVPCVDSNYIAPCRVSFKQNGVQRNWDYIKKHDSVSVLIYNKTRKSFVLVKQFRPALFMNCNEKMNNKKSTVVKNETDCVPVIAPFVTGVSYELCAGIVDKAVPLVEIAEDEILEETGYKVKTSELKKLFTHWAVGTAGNSGTVYFVEVTDDMKTSDGGGNRNEGEFIEVFHLPLHEAKNFVFSDDYPKTSSTVAAFCWFFLNHSVED